MKTLTDPESACLRAFVDEVLYVIRRDDDGITWDLEDSALRCAEILGMHVNAHDTNEDSFE